MILVEKNFCLPKETLEAFEQKCDREKQGELVASLIEKWLEESARTELRTNLAEGACYMSDVALEIEREFNPIDEELHRGVEY